MTFIQIKSFYFEQTTFINIKLYLKYKSQQNITSTLFFPLIDIVDGVLFLLTYQRNLACLIIIAHAPQQAQISLGKSFF